MWGDGKYPTNQTTLQTTTSRRNNNNMSSIIDTLCDFGKTISNKKEGELRKAAINWLIDSIKKTNSRKDDVYEPQVVETHPQEEKNSKKEEKEEKEEEKKNTTAEIKPEIVKLTTPDWRKAGIVLPFCGWIDEASCQGVKLNHKLYTQCPRNPIDGTKLCKICTRQKKKSPTDTPTYGYITERAKFGIDFVDPKGGKAVPYANVAANMNIKMGSAEKEAAKYGWTIPDEHKTIRKAKRGRPKKNKSAATDDDGAEKKKRGRPKKKVEDKKSALEKMADELPELEEEPIEEPIEDILKNEKSVADEIMKSVVDNKEEEEEDEEEEYPEGSSIKLGKVYGAIQIIDGTKYVVAPDQDDADDDKYIWTIPNSEGETECLGFLEDGKIQPFECDSSDDEEE